LWCSPDSKKIAVLFHSGKKYSYKVIFYTVKGVVLGNIETDSMYEGWTPDSLYRVATSDGKTADVNLNGTVVRLYDISDRSIKTWSPDGKLMSVSNSCCESDIFIYDLDAKLRHKFQHNSPNTGNVKWSPDSKSILVIEDGKAVWLYKLP
jgi:dipeptidyl aminopeptidase/acylaminoacyl peptidase